MLFIRIFTSVDVIEDTQKAIIEFNQIPENSIPNRSTLYIYGVLQATYCQQDGVISLYQSIFEEKLNKKDKTGIYKIFEKYNSNIQIRRIRDNIAGHPADANHGKEFYFIAKKSNKKNKFTFAGYKPEFVKVNVDIKELIDEQEHFVISALSDIESGIIKRITNHKKKFMNIKLSDYIEEFESCKIFIIKGVYNANFGIDTNDFEKELLSLKKELNKRYFNDLPENLDCVLKKIYFILERLNFLDKNRMASENIEMDILIESFELQITALKHILLEIDAEFEKN